MSIADLTPEQVVRGTSATYGIVWDVNGDIIAPRAVLGNHSFSEASRSWKFDFGEGCVGRAYAKHKTLIVEDAVGGEATFLRKQIAKDCGINAIVFVPQEDGSVLEVGFERKLSELSQSLWMRNILESYAKELEIKDFDEDIHRMRTPSPASCLNVQSPSLRALARVAVCWTGDWICRPSIMAIENGTTHLMQEEFQNAVRRSPSCSTSSSSDVSWEAQEEIGDEEDVGMDGQAKDTGFDEGCAELPKPTLLVDLANHIPNPMLNITKPFQSPPGLADPHENAPPIPNFCSLPPNALCNLPSVSLGSVGHPTSCGGACKFIKTQKGCKQGATCSRCHLCMWTRASERGLSQRKKVNREFEDALCAYLDGHTTEGQNGQELYEESNVSSEQPGLDRLQGTVGQAHVSAGTVGHPYLCGGACKYLKTQKGCKMGASCDRCHLCFWTRASERDLARRKKDYSLGSIGHPHLCAGACKYHTKKECKQGASCDRCHMCTWTRAGELALVKRKNQYLDGGCELSESYAFANLPSEPYTLSC
mmetsp:Transcript_14018/g.22052  ORF Transcript_14018/g.22052 Transcript_14018/m.22052 type:complete len:535 (-) Transcript_14018:157-1761(-)